MKNTFALALVIVCWAIASENDYQIKSAAAKEAAEKKGPEAARVWSRRCERQGKDTLASKKDAEPWKITCIPKRTLAA